MLLEQGSRSSHRFRWLFFGLEQRGLLSVCWSKSFDNCNLERWKLFWDHVIIQFAGTDCVLVTPVYPVVNSRRIADSRGSSALARLAAADTQGLSPR